MRITLRTQGRQSILTSGGGDTTAIKKKWLSTANKVDAKHPPRPRSGRRGRAWEGVSPPPKEILSFDDYICENLPYKHTYTIRFTQS